jgi:hypothetical protein
MSSGVIDTELVAHSLDECLGVQRTNCLDFEPEEFADSYRLRLRKMGLDQVAMYHVPFGVLGGGLVRNHNFDHEDWVWLRNSW